MGKSIRSKIKRKYRAQRAQTVNALGIEEEKLQKKQAALKGCLEAPGPQTVPSATPMQIGQTNSRVQKKKKKATKEKSWSMLARKHAEQVQMES